MEGSTNAEDKARKARLQEQLSSAQDSLKDTIVDHAYNLQSDSLERLSSDMAEDFEKWTNDIRGNIDKMSDAISDALKNAGISNKQVRSNLKKILVAAGIPEDSVNNILKATDITGYASGTNYVPKSDIYRVNEKGQEIINSKRYGLITYLEKGDSVYPANISEQILAGASTVTNSNLPDFGEMAKGLENTVSNTNVGNNTYISNFYINGSDDPETLMKQIDKHINELIEKNDKKRVRDFKSLH